MASPDQELFSFDVVVKYDDERPASGVQIYVVDQVLAKRTQVYADAEGRLPFPNMMRPDPETGLVQGYLPRGDYFVVIEAEAGMSRRTVMPLFVPERRSLL